MLKKYASLSWFLFISVLFSCSEDDMYVPIEPVSPVVLDINEVPYQTLSEYNFFEDNMSDLNPVYGVLPFDLNSTLFSDYAQKKRFVWMPSDVRATYVNDYTPLDFPTGSVLIKNFYYDNVLPNNETIIIETRLMIKREDSWIFANYVWNENQTEANFTTNSSNIAFEWLENNTPKSVNYRVPSFSECFTCHNKYDEPLPIGPKPQNLNKNFTYADGLENQLSKWVEQGYLEDNYPSGIVSTVNWGDESEPLNLRARSYFDINCAHCHSERSYCEYTSMRFEFNLSEDIDNLGVCIDPGFYINEDLEKIVTPGYAEQSVLHFRISATEDEYRMPLIGRTLVHEEGVQLIEQWINSLNSDCQ